MSCTLACVAGGFLLDTSVGIYTLEALFPRNGSKNCTVNNPISFISEQHNKSIYVRREIVFSEKNSGNCCVGGKSDVHQLKLILMQMQNEVVVRKLLTQSFTFCGSIPSQM